MPLHRQPPITPLGLNLAPLVDVVMCLIIFFMLATKLVERENSAIDLPAASVARETEKKELGRRVVVNVQHSAGGPQAARYVIEQRTLTLPDVERRLAAEHGHDPEVRCVIRGDRELPYREIESVLAACSRAGITRVWFAAAREERR